MISKKKIMYLISFVICLLCFVTFPQNSYGKTVNGNKVYSKDTCNQRIEVIRNYYNNKQSQLTKVNKKIEDSTYGNLNLTYYLNGKDLQFCYGGNKKVTYRMYFYKNQMIRMLVDRPGKNRVTYKQKYDDYKYVCYQLYGQLVVGSQKKVSKKFLSDQLVLVYKITDSYVYYYKLYTSGCDGSFWRIKTTPYKAKLADSYKVVQDFPYDVETVSKSTFKKYVKNSSFGQAVYLSGKNSKVKEIEIAYFA